MRRSTWLGLLKEAMAAWSNDHAARMAAALAYYSTFSMAPLLIIVIWVGGLIFGAEAAQGQVFGQLQATLGAAAAEMLQNVLQHAYEREDHGAWASIIGIGLLVLGATG